MERSDIVLTYSTVLMSIGFSNIIAYISFNYPFFMRRTISTRGRARTTYIASWWILAAILALSIKGLFNLNKLLSTEIDTIDRLVLTYLVPLSYIVIPFHTISTITNIYTVFLKNELIQLYREKKKKKRDWIKLLGRPKIWILSLLRVSEEEFCTNSYNLDRLVCIHKYKTIRDAYLLASILLFLFFLDKLYQADRAVFYLAIIATIAIQSIPHRRELPTEKCSKKDREEATDNL